MNPRAEYWAAEQAILVGVAFENSEMRGRFRDGQRFVFGVTKKEPPEIGLR